MTLTLTIGPWRLQLNIGRAPEPEQHPDQPAPPIHIDTPMAIYAEPVEQHCGFRHPMETT